MLLFFFFFFGFPNGLCVQCAICECYFFCRMCVCMRVCGGRRFLCMVKSKKKLTKVNKQMYDKYWLEILRVLFVPVEFFFSSACLHKAIRQGYCTQNVCLFIPSNFDFDTMKAVVDVVVVVVQQFLSNVPFELFYMKVCFVLFFFSRIVYVFFSLVFRLKCFFNSSIVVVVVG